MNVPSHLRKDFDEICKTLDYTEGTAFKKEWIKKDILKTLKQCGGLDYRLFPPTFRWNLCSARLTMGRFDNWDGWEYRSNWSMTFMGYNGYQLKAKRWMGEPVEKLIILGEQGVGDEIFYSSCLPDLMVRIGKKPIEFQTYPRLIPIIERSYGIKCTERRGLGDVEGTVMALADLMRWYRRDISHFPKKPYFKPNPERVLYWKDVLKGLPGRKIGIAWKSRHGDLNVFDLMHEQGTYINLQYCKPGDDLGLPGNLIDLGLDPWNDLEDQFALIAALDHVITVTQTVVHLCGSIGKSCDAIIPPKGTGEVDYSLWYYGTGEGNEVPAYGTVKVWKNIEFYKRNCQSG